MCGVSLLYGDGSCGLGFMLTDKVAVEDTSVDMVFGELTVMGGTLDSTSTDGIVGFAYSSLSNGFPTLMDNFHTQAV